MRLTSKQVEAFHRVFIAGSITTASEQLNLSQPAVSRLVADFERALGMMLFERKNRRLYPTPEGRMMFDEIERSFVGLEKISTRAEEIRSFRSGSVRIAVMPALSLSVLPTVIKDFMSRYPEVHISLNTSLSESVFDWMGSDKMDIGIAALPAHKTVAQIELLPCSPCRCILPAASALADREVITPEDLADVPFISMMANSMLRLRIDAVFQAAGIQRQMVLETPYSLSAMQFAKLGLGATIVDPFSARIFSDDAVVVKPFVPDVPYEFGLLFPGTPRLSLAAQQFTDNLRKVTQDF